MRRLVNVALIVIRWLSIAVFLIAAMAIANKHHEATFAEVVALPQFKIAMGGLIVYLLNAKFEQWLGDR